MSDIFIQLLFTVKKKLNHPEIIVNEFKVITFEKLIYIKN